ncbi:tRNA pseudouridine(38-40) synthase TruA [Helicobacter sp. WB40]|uniref:tRNA pseudouridine(38-40) synthase TruA n=1 Tax=Helicobacter sp. WB40 TaxID=3004130 RepID=UPI0022EC0CF4|nr:tRNA pseudouridine(38-40) synthase TruA [Helicobacter sp. WB40]MDA3966425.1 tRNA pseudouridine(38-40) synthase TruA [Helicobacter sp. WB40]
MNIAMILSYDGSYFNGFQSQSDKSGVYDFLQEKLNSVGIFNKFQASGRTDKGVHANYQVISLNIPSFHKNLESLKEILNNKLYPKVRIKKMLKVDSNFHARYSAKKRSYCYIISTKYSPFLANFSHYHKLENPKLLKDSIKLLEGIHDFSSFMKKGGSGELNQTRIMYKTRILKYKDFYIFYFCSNGFLRSQIRLMVGYLLEIDKNTKSIESLKDALLNKSQQSILKAQANGLFLNKVYY